MNFDDAYKTALDFRNERDWAQFHNLKDLAISINLEASELLELFQWSGDATDVADKHDAMKEELADVLIYCIFFADKLGIDIPEAIGQKIKKDAQKYPVSKARGSSRKYTEL